MDCFVNWMGHTISTDTRDRTNSDGDKSGSNNTVNNSAVERKNRRRNNAANMLHCGYTSNIYVKRRNFYCWIKQLYKA
ncbi:hypothetical protein GF1_12000 [Desulfolithobacter dissulfuricans]|uniref:Uncharacterized protein n=1 Tax=Desulfolithobacter dissulfuricans TaxID=2795293 RepID=A0A915XHM1_9BACT|nr:hypothetical protein GF1_12000 [Desulfolithobacter dissulfuricans]